MQKWLKRFFSKNAAQLEVFYNIGQYFLVFWEKVVSIWSVIWEKVVSILTFFTDHNCHHWVNYQILQLRFITTPQIRDFR